MRTTMDIEEIKLIQSVLQRKMLITHKPVNYIRDDRGFVMSRDFPVDASFPIVPTQRLFYDPVQQNFGSGYNTRVFDVLFNLKDVEDLFNTDKVNDIVFNIMLLYGDVYLGTIIYALMYIELNPGVYSLFCVETINDFIKIWTKR